MRMASVGQSHIILLKQNRCCATFPIYHISAEAYKKLLLISYLKSIFPTKRAYCSCSFSGRTMRRDVLYLPSPVVVLVAGSWLYYYYYTWKTSPIVFCFIVGGYLLCVVFGPLGRLVGLDDVDAGECLCALPCLAYPRLLLLPGQLSNGVYSVDDGCGDMKPAHATPAESHWKRAQLPSFWQQNVICSY